MHYGLIHHSLLPQGNGLCEKWLWQKKLLYPGLFPYLSLWDEVAFWPFLWGRICLSKVKVFVAHSCLILCYPMNCSPSGCAVHGVLQARILKWVAIPFSGGFSRPSDQTWVSHIAGRFFHFWATREALFIVPTISTPYPFLLFLPPVSTLSQPSHCLLFLSHCLLSPKPGNSLLVSLRLFIHSTDIYTGHCIC